MLAVSLLRMNDCVLWAVRAPVGRRLLWLAPWADPARHLDNVQRMFPFLPLDFVSLTLRISVGCILCGSMAGQRVVSAGMEDGGQQQRFRLRQERES